MTINFNFKKYFKYFIIFLLCYIILHAFTNAKALSYNNGSLNISTGSFDNITDMLSSGGESDLKTYFNDNVVNNGSIDNYITDLHTSIYTASGYNSFNDFEEDNYYAIVYYWVNNGIYNTFVYYTDKENGQFHFNLVADSQSSSSIAYNTEIRFTYAPDMYSSYFNGNLSTLVYSGLYGTYNNNLIYTGPNTWNPIFVTYCQNQYRPDCTTTWNGNTSTLTAPIGTFISNTGRKFFYESNMSLDLYLDTYSYRYSSNNDTARYFHNYYINNGLNNSTDLPYTLGDFLTTLFDSGPVYVSPNVQNLGNNSYGINNNFVSVSFIDSSISPPNNTIIECPNDRDLINNICYIYNSDVEDFDFSNTSYHNSVRYFLGDSTNIPLRENYFYIATIRIYTPYNLKISNIRVSSGNLNSSVTINDVVVRDYFIYKDYQIVFTPNVTGELAINFLDIYFNNYSEFTDVLPDDISFGAFNFIKYSEFSSQPTTTDINHNYSNDSLDTISTNQSSSFFTNFKINDRGLSQVVLLPLNFVRSWTNATCTPISLPLPHLANAQLPCLSSTFSQYFGSFWTLYKIIINGFIIYRICINLLRIIKNIYDVENNKIEVIDL